MREAITLATQTLNRVLNLSASRPRSEIFASYGTRFLSASSPNSSGVTTSLALLSESTAIAALLSASSGTGILDETNPWKPSSHN